MFFIMTIGADKLQIFLPIVVPISVFMMDLQYLMFAIATTLAFQTSLLKKFDLQRLLRLDFIFPGSA